MLSNCSDQSSLSTYLNRFSQNSIGNANLLFIIEFMRKRNNHRFPNNYAKNQAAFRNHAITRRNHNGYIEDQQNYNDMSFGIKPLSVNGCGLIAIYNVLYYFTKNDNINFAAII